MGDVHIDHRRLLVIDTIFIIHCTYEERGFPQ